PEDGVGDVLPVDGSDDHHAQEVAHQAGAALAVDQAHGVLDQGPVGGRGQGGVALGVGRDDGIEGVAVGVGCAGSEGGHGTLDLEMVLRQSGAQAQRARHTVPPPGARPPPCFCRIWLTAITAWVRELTPSARSTAATWSLTVSTDRPSSRAMSLLGCPLSSSVNTSDWRGVRPSCTSEGTVWKAASEASFWTWV